MTKASGACSEHRCHGQPSVHRAEDNIAQAGLEIADVSGRGVWRAMLRTHRPDRLGGRLEVGRVRSLPVGPRRRFGRAVALGLVVWAAVVAGCTNGGGQGTASGGGSFDSNGERIYFTSTSDSGDAIDYEGGPGSGGMMVDGGLSCASCHGSDVRGGRHRMHMDVMDAPDIRWVALAEEDHDDHGEDTSEHDAGYDVDAFRSAVMGGVHSDGEPLSDDMPRWTMSERDLQDLIEYLRSFDEP